MEGRFRQYSKIVSLEIRESDFRYYMLAFRSVLLIYLLFAYIIQYAQKSFNEYGWSEKFKNFQNNIKAFSIFLNLQKCYVCSELWTLINTFCSFNTLQLKEWDQGKFSLKLRFTCYRGIFLHFSAINHLHLTFKKLLFINNLFCFYLFCFFIV